MAGAAHRDILGDSRSAKRCILQYKNRLQDRIGRSPKRRVRDDDFVFGLCSDIVGYPRIVFLLAEALQGVSAQILSFKISWQAQYLVRLEGDFTCSAHWNDVSYVTQISDDVHFAWQAQYLVKCESDFSWQAQHFVTFWEIAGTRNVVFYNTKSFPRWYE